jgi:hypothetical protein
MLAHRLSQAPDSRSKPQLQLATLPGDPPFAYPPCPTTWDIGVIGTGRTLSGLHEDRCV